MMIKTTEDHYHECDIYQTVGEMRSWIWARSERTIPIPGFRTVAQIEENTAAMQFGPLSAEQMREIDILLGR